MDFFQPMAYLCLLGCFMGDKAAWRSGTSHAKPSMKVHQQVNKFAPSCQGPNWGKREEMKIKKIHVFSPAMSVISVKKTKNVRDYDMTYR